MMQHEPPGPNDAARLVTRRCWALHCSRLALHAAAAFGLALTLPGVTAQAQTKAPATLLVVGDSLSAEYGLPRGSGWVALLEQRLAQERLPWQVVNASVSGETSSGGRTRLPALLARHKPQLVVIELGANDALRGLPMSVTQKNLAEMARLAKASDAKVLIAGILMPPNYGRSYNEKLSALFADVARAEGAALVPFILAGVADAPDARDLFQPDGIHPTAQAHPRMLDNIWPALQPLLRLK